MSDPTSGPYAKVIADSISPEGVRLTTMEVRFHRFVLAEFNTHRVFSRNSASSRAIPAHKMLNRVMENPALPLSWPHEQKGMQGGDEFSEEGREYATEQWLKARDAAVDRAQVLITQGLHKSVVNRLLEPFMWHTAVVTSTAWDNFSLQRVHEDAQPEIFAVATLMINEALAGSTPKHLIEGEWHLPYIDPEDWEAVFKLFREEAEIKNIGRSAYPEMARISAARCGRTSYLTQDGKRDVAEDLDLYSRLIDRESEDDPRHWSPLEHVATPWAQNRQNDYWHGLNFDGLDGVNRHVETNHLPKVGNLLGWRSLRTEVETQKRAVTFR